MSGNQYWKYDIEGSAQSSGTAEFNGENGEYQLLQEWYIGPANYAQIQNDDQASIAQKYKDQFLQDATGYITAEIESYLGAGTVLKIELLDATVTWIKVRNGIWWQFPLVQLPLAECQMKIDWKATVWTTKPLEASPMPEWVITLIIKLAYVVLAGAIAYWAIQAVQAVLTSMVTKSYKIVTTYPDGTKKEETGTQPDLGGTIIVVIGAVIAIVIVAALFMGRGRSKE